MGSAAFLSGRTRVVAIMGDPIAQVKSPAGVTAALRAQERDCVVVPIHVSSAHVAAFMDGASLAHNLDGLIATVPHKFAAFQACSTASPRARFLEAANILRRNPDGTWHGDMVDGVGFVSAARSAGLRPEGRHALLAGAGGAGSAIAFSLLDAGVAQLAIHDADPVRRDALLARLAKRHPGRVRAGSGDPSGHDVLVNATPAGMRPGDAPPFDLTRLSREAFVGDVITVPEVTPLLAAARTLGCATLTGVGMFEAVMREMVAFLLEAGPLAHPAP